MIFAGVFLMPQPGDRPFPMGGGCQGLIVVAGRIGYLARPISSPAHVEL